MSRVKHLKNSLPDVKEGDWKSMTEFMKAVRDNIETITGQKGPSGAWHVSFDDLVALGVVTSKDVNEYVAKRKND